MNSAYGYEDRLQSLKHCLNSRYTRVESLVRKFKVEKRLIECETDSSENNIRCGLISKDYSSFHSTIFTQLGYATVPEQIYTYLTFHRTVYLNYLQISTTKFKLGDSFIRSSDAYFRVHVIFKHLGIVYLLCEKVKMLSKVSIQIQHPITKQPYKTTLKHHTVVDELDTKEYVLLKLENVKKQVCLVELHSGLIAKTKRKHAIVEMFN